MVEDGAQATRAAGEQAVQATKAVSSGLTNGAAAAVDKTALATPATGVRTTSSGRAARTAPTS